MANPVRAARKEGRAMVKGVKQGIKAEKITKKFQAKADKIGMKARQAEKAKAPSEPMTKMEPRKAPLLETKKAELAKGSPMKVAAAPAKKSSSAKSKAKTSTSKYGPYKGDMKADRTKSTGKAKSKSTVKKGLYDGVADPNKKVGDYTVREVTEGAKNTVKAAAADALTVPFKLTKKATQASKNQAKRALNAATLGIFEDYLKTEKKIGGVAKPSYKKGGYMMNAKKKKK